MKNEEWLQEFYNNIDILGELETLFFKYIDKDAKSHNYQNESSFLKLFDFINKNEVLMDYYKYHAFLQIISNVSLSRTSNQNIYEKIMDVILELQKNFCLKETFSSETIFHIFIDNKIMLLYLLDNDLISFQQIQDHIINISSHEYESIYFILFFWPEFINSDVNYIKKVSKLINFDVSHQDAMNMMSETFLNSFHAKRHASHSNFWLAKLIRKDDVAVFSSIMINNSYDINYMFHFPLELILNKKFKSLNELFEDDSNPIIDFIFEPNMQLYNISLIDYAIAFASVNIFKYLLDQGAMLSDHSFKFAILGGNNEIIHILEEKKISPSAIKLCMFESIRYSRINIYEYFSLKYQPNNVFDSLMYSSIANIQFKIMSDLIKQNYCNSDPLTVYKEISKYFVNSPAIILHQFLITHPNFEQIRVEQI